VANRFLRWDKVEGAAGYNIRIKKDSPPDDTATPDVMLADVDVYDLLTAPSLANANGTYHFSIRAVNGAGIEGETARVAGPLAFAKLAAPSNFRLADS